MDAPCPGASDAPNVVSRILAWLSFPGAEIRESVAAHPPPLRGQKRPVRLRQVEAGQKKAHKYECFFLADES